MKKVGKKNSPKVKKEIQGGKTDCSEERLDPKKKGESWEHRKRIFEGWALRNGKFKKGRPKKGFREALGRPDYVRECCFVEYGGGGFTLHSEGLPKGESPPWKTIYMKF